MIAAAIRIIVAMEGRPALEEALVILRDFPAKRITSSLACRGQAVRVTAAVHMWGRYASALLVLIGKM
jgi:hypothetical protein